MSTNWREAKLNAADYAMLEFSERLTLLPCDMKETDVAGLRRHGFTDREILSITLAAAYRNFITRVADALGVELRRGENYAPEILHAFGVTEEEAQTTMYRKRQVAEQEASSHPALPPDQPSPANATQGICWIEIPGDPSKEVEEAAGSGFPRNLACALNLRPEALRATLGFGRLTSFGGSGLGRRLESLIGLTVASSLQVPYMITHHTRALQETHGEADVREQAIARFCEKLTRLPSPMARSDLEALRACGFGDRELLTIVASIAFENFLGRVAAGIGVQ